MQDSGPLAETQLVWARNTLARAKRPELLRWGFFPVFPDGSLLEGSQRREGTKFLRDKQPGLIWSTVFAGPVVAAQSLAGEGEGEETCVRRMLAPVTEKVLKPLRLRQRALVLADSLHGDDPTLNEIERLRLHYVVGVNKLTATDETLADQPEEVWQDTGADAGRGWSHSSLCDCWIQCKDWKKKRILIGRRWMREGEFIWNYSGVVTDLTEEDVAHVIGGGRSYAEAIWLLYDLKMGMETQYQDLLSDLGLHHPPCRKLIRNAGFYAVATLAHTLGVAVDLIGGVGLRHGATQRRGVAKRKRRKPRRMRLWRLRRRFFALPGRVARRSATLKITLLGLSETVRREFERIFLTICQS
jgi:hypothetical protein